MKLGLRSRLRWVGSAFIKEPWKDLWVSWRWKLWLWLWHSDKQLSWTSVVSVRQEGGHVESPLASITQCLPYPCHGDPGSMMLSAPLTDGWTRWDSGRWSDLPRDTINSQVRIWTQAFWLQVCGPSTILQLLPEPLSWIIQTKQAGFLLFEGKVFHADWLIEVGCPLWFILSGQDRSPISFCRDTDQRHSGSV